VNHEVLERNSYHDEKSSPTAAWPKCVEQGKSVYRWTDVDLSQRGREEAVEAGELLNHMATRSIVHSRPFLNEQFVSFGYCSMSWI
jgi:hypothetical protein